jgi:hypothetical protein
VSDFDKLATAMTAALGKSRAETKDTIMFNVLKQASVLDPVDASMRARQKEIGDSIKAFAGVEKEALQAQCTVIGHKWMLTLRSSFSNDIMSFGSPTVCEFCGIEKK